jgi:hypothetical protein
MEQVWCRLWTEFKPGKKPVPAALCSLHLQMVDADRFVKARMQERSENSPASRCDPTSIIDMQDGTVLFLVEVVGEVYEAVAASRHGIFSENVPIRLWQSEAA